jgi:uncharacterized protein (DUF433 family)
VENWLGTGFGGTVKSIDWQDCKAVDRNPEKLGGKWCFAGTRMPVVSLFDHLDQGATIDEFLEWFPDVPAALVHEVLQFAMASLERPVAVA